MANSCTPAQINRFKREAKRFHRASDISHSEALDRIANSNGYSNWSLLMKHSGSDDKAQAMNSGPLHRFLRTPAQMRLALLKVPEPRGWGSPSRIDSAKAQVGDISAAFVSPHNAATFAIEYATCLLTVPRFKVYSAAPVYWEMRSWLPYGCQSVAGGARIIVNRGYKPVGQVSNDWAKYEDFQHLHVQLTPEQCEQFKAPGASAGYLFNDGCAPWESRSNAAAYLDRLRRLRDALRN